MCKSTSAIIDQLIHEHNDIVKIDVSKHPKISSEFGVLASPSMAIIDHGRIETLFVGSKSKQQIKTLLSSDPNGT